MSKVVLDGVFLSVLGFDADYNVDLSDKCRARGLGAIFRSAGVPRSVGVRS